MFTELKIIEWGEQVSKAFITIYGYKLLELHKTMKFKKAIQIFKILPADQKTCINSVIEKSIKIFVKKLSNILTQTI